MRSFEAGSADSLWSAAAALFAGSSVGPHLLAEAPREQPSRAGPTRELLHVSFLLTDPRQRWVFSREPALNPAFALAEALWILEGRNDAAFLNAWNARLPEYCGYGDTYHGAYGFRIRRAFGFDQLLRVHDVLRADPASRQAVLLLWDPRQDMPGADGTPKNQDIPCNIASFVRIRDGRLEWTQVMRSNDLFLGLPHNIVQFTILQEVLAGWLGVEVGAYFHLSDSLHVYQRDLPHFEHVGDQQFATNPDNLSLSKAESQVVLGDLSSRANRLAADDLQRTDLRALTTNSELPRAYMNILLVFAAEAARRHGWSMEAEAFARDISNPALSLLWSRWRQRVGMRDHEHALPVSAP
jgi:thymidylate synthase